MGIENRDYTREGDYTGTLGGWGLDHISPVVKWLIAANVVVFLLQIFLTRAMTPVVTEPTAFTPSFHFQPSSRSR